MPGKGLQSPRPGTCRTEDYPTTRNTFKPPDGKQKPRKPPPVTHPDTAGDLWRNHGFRFLTVPLTSSGVKRNRTPPGGECWSGRRGLLGTRSQACQLRASKPEPGPLATRDLGQPAAQALLGMTAPAPDTQLRGSALGGTTCGGEAARREASLKQPQAQTTPSSTGSFLSLSQLRRHCAC